MELSEEEKKAIEWLEKAKFFSARLYAPIILNVIDKLKNNLHEEQEQNEYLKDKVDKQQKEIDELRNNELDYTTIYINGVYEGKKYYKDKIREIFQFHIEQDSLFNDDPHKMAVIRLKDILQELLEEK